MSAWSAPPIFVAGITVYIGLFHLLLYFQQHQRADLLFALMTLAISAYCLLSAGLYSATTIAEGASWQRGQLAAISLVLLAVVWFITHYTGTRSPRGVLLLISVFAVGEALAALLIPGWPMWEVNTPAIKEIALPFGLNVTYYEIQQGPLANFFVFSQIALAVPYIVYRVDRFWRAQRSREARLLLGSLVLFMLAGLNDAAIWAGLYRSVYLIELGYLSLVLAVTLPLMNTVAQGANMRAALETSEQAAQEFLARLKTLHEVSAELSQITDLSELCRQAVELGRSRLGFDRLGIWLLDPSDPAYVQGAWGTDPQGQTRDERSKRYALETEPRLQAVLHNRERVMVWQAAPLLDYQQAVGTGWNAVALLWNGDQAVGWLAADNLLSQRPLARYQPEILALYGTTIGHLVVRLRAEHELRASEYRFRSVVEQSIDGIRLVDHNGILIEWNQGCERITGLARSEVLGQPIWDVLYQLAPDERKSPEGRERVKALTLDMLRTGKTDWQTEKARTIQRPDGTRRLVETVVFTIPAETGFMACGLLHDITDLMQAEEARRLSEERYRRATEVGEVGVWEWDMQTRSLYISPNSLSMLGYAEQGKDFILSQWKNLLDPADVENALTVLRDYLQGHTPLWEVEFRVRHGDGSTRHVVTRASVVRDDQGQPARLAGTLFDITETRHLLDSLKRRDAILQAVNQTAAGLLRAPDWREVVPGILETLGQATGVDCVMIFENRVDESGNLTVSARYEWTAPGITPQIDNPHLQNILPIQAGYENWVKRFRHGEPITGHARDFPPAEQVLLTLSGSRSIILVPVFVHDRWWGLLDLSMMQAEREWLPVEIDSLRAAARILGTAIERQQAQESLQRRQSEMETLLETSHALSGTLDLDTLLRLIADHVITLFGATACDIMQLGSDNLLRSVLAIGPYAEQSMAFAIPLGEGLSGYSVLHNQPVLANDAQADDRAVLIPGTPNREREHVMVAPLTAQGRPIGAMLISRGEDRLFTENDLALFTGLAQQVATALYNAQLHQALAQHSANLAEAVEQRTAELRQTTERIETILNNSPDGVLLLRQDGTISQVNPAACRLLEWEPDHVQGRSPLQFVVPDYVQVLQDALRITLEQGEAVRLAILARAGNGRIFDADLAFAPIKQAGVVVGAVCSLRDISALKEAERMKDTFVSNVTHELRTPITNLKLYYDLLERQPEKRQSYLATLRRETDRLARTIEDLLTLSRIDQGRVAWQPDLIDLNQLAAQYVADRLALAGSRQITLSFEGEAGLPLLYADAGLVGQALSVLLTNAIAYTPAGGKVWVNTCSTDYQGQAWVGMGVRDNGPGILPDEQPHLFERFFRGTAGRESGTSGTGLGLSIVREIARKHQGRVEVISAGVPGLGATFILWLPLRNQLG